MREAQRDRYSVVDDWWSFARIWEACTVNPASMSRWTETAELQSGSFYSRSFPSPFCFPLLEQDGLGDGSLLSDLVL